MWWRRKWFDGGRNIAMEGKCGDRGRSGVIEEEVSGISPAEPAHFRATTKWTIAWLYHNKTALFCNIKVGCILGALRQSKNGWLFYLHHLIAEEAASNDNITDNDEDDDSNRRYQDWLNDEKSNDCDDDYDD
ncbi:hypothetical protein EVAR_87367_1 [Eumeta japonica]|uniref:Uncharacterized protein n=1 Tax=Eumeta variegata TaxID=151549 RepID=A0A4C1XZN8_EUMVA|nr:hypothetical protein EVAR_87367_1 [Eumeta japonica]